MNVNITEVATTIRTRSESAPSGWWNVAIQLFSGVSRSRSLNHSCPAACSVILFIGLIENRLDARPAALLVSNIATPLIVRHELSVLFLTVILKQSAEQFVGDHGDHENATREADDEQSRQYRRQE